MDEDKLFEIVRNAYNEVNTDYLKSQVLAAVAEIGLTRQEVMDGLLDWIVVGGCTGVNDRYRPYIYGALALLKDQEPRVLTLEELRDVGQVWESSAPPYLWLDKNRSIYNTISFWCAWRDIYEMIHGRHDKYTDENYGSEWRCWTARPTEEQRKVVPWNE